MMNLSLPDYYNNNSEGSESRFTGFQNLMRRRIHEILLVSSLYDSYILAQDGLLSNRILDEFEELNLYQTPNITRVSGANAALKLIREENRFDLVITTMRIGEMDAINFARELKETGLEIPLVLLTYETHELHELSRLDMTSVFDRVFLWQGDFRILLAIIKSIEDRLNVENDTEFMGVQVIILIEDNTRFYSAYLPMIYTEVMKHSQNLITEGVNLPHKMLRMRARPKILLCEDFEEAWDYFEKYDKYILGVISDIEFKQGGKTDPEAGAHFVKSARKIRPDVPILLQSFRPDTEEYAFKLGVDFLRKDSPTLISELRSFMIENYGFGEFVFRMPDGREVGHATDLQSLEDTLKTVPAESIKFHGERNHFSCWLKARTEFLLADKLKPRKVSDYSSLETLREYLLTTLRDFRRHRAQGQVADFDEGTFDPTASFARIGDGSMGGKARGLAFVNYFLERYKMADRITGVHISIPSMVVLCTDVFDSFMETNQLLDFAVQCSDDVEIIQRFVEAKFPVSYSQHLWDLIESIGSASYPLAVRSSSLLEDSQYQPFAGVYNTYMLSNNQGETKQRYSALVEAIKLVYASVYMERSKQYILATPYRLEEEKMAVIIQRLVGENHQNRFYPDISGVARSYNYYSKKPMTSSDGIASAVLGLGETVVRGENCVRFCPKYPQYITHAASISDYIDQSQKEFYAVDIEASIDTSKHPLVSNLKKYRLDVAEKDGTLHRIGSVYSLENDAIYDGLSRKGQRLVTFAPLLKFKLFPLPEILNLVLDLGKHGMGGPVEIEFAANLSENEGGKKEFAILQMRPMVLNREIESLDFGNIADSQLICSAKKVLGFGKIDTLYDLIYVDIARFNRSKSADIARDVAFFNAALNRENRPYMLVGMGRWGSTDPWLGIPVAWEQISGAKVIVESGFKDVRVTPSQGAHFFHNLVSFQVGYFTVNPESGGGLLDWEWLVRQPVLSERGVVCHLRFDSPIVVKMNGFKNRGVIFKPEVKTDLSTGNEDELD